MTSSASLDFDVLIIGAGPAGLCLATALSGHGLRIGVVEQQSISTLADPPPDGREIGLSQPSVRTLQRLGLWTWLQQHAPHALSPLRDALVLNGNGTHTTRLHISHTLGRHGELGWLVANHQIRRAAWAQIQRCHQTHADITLVCGKALTHAHTHADRAEAVLADGQVLQSRLLVAADSRFSPTRRALGLGADMHDFGRSMLLCTMELEHAHDHVAWQWFGQGQTLALLPMLPDAQTGAHRASCILTLAQHQLQMLQSLDDTAFSTEMTRRFESRLGKMQVRGVRHIAPLVGVYARQMSGPRIACVGDAAVGMHPITAHGFNFGLRSIDTLSTLLLQAHADRRDVGDAAVLQRYASAHRRATWPLYQATTAIARLYTTDHGPARWLRAGALRLADRALPFKKTVAWSLAGS